MDDFTANVGNVTAALTPEQAGDASGRAMTVRERLVDTARFAVAPRPAVQPLAWGRAAALGLLVVLALDLALDTMASAAIAASDERAGFLPAPVDLPTTLAEDLFGFLILAPVLEEMAFRGWLSGRVAALRFALYGFAAMALSGASLLVDPAWAMPVMLTATLLVFTGLVQWSRSRDRDTQVPSWFTRHFRWLVWGSSLAFGLIHLGNYAPLAHPLGLSAIVPQTIGGVLLAYSRTRFGLVPAIAHHAAYNAIFLASDYGW